MFDASGVVTLRVNGKLHHIGVGRTHARSFRSLETSQWVSDGIRTHDTQEPQLIVKSHSGRGRPPGAGALPLAGTLWLV